MPPVVIIVLGAVGAFAAVKFIAREARRINAELHPEGGEPAYAAEPADRGVRLRRDPHTGVYRPD